MQVIPCFACSPSATVTWQRPQIPRPPQTESRSTPSLRAASSTDVPRGTRPRRPDGVKTTSASPLTSPRRPPAAVASAAAPGLRAAPAPSPFRAIHAAQCGSFPIITSAALIAWSISPCNGLVIAEVRPEAIAIGRNAAFSAGAVRQPEADVRGAARRVHPELVLEPAEEPEHLAPGRAHRADRHHERVDDDVLARDAVILGARDDLPRDLEADVRDPR